MRRRDPQDNAWHVCERKVRHRSAKKAKNVIRNIKRRGNLIAYTLGVYHCSLCNGYHIGNSRYRK